jgi:hypothetical protein
MAFNFHFFYWDRRFLAVMPITLPRDAGYCSPFWLSAHFELRGSARCKRTSATSWKF